MRSQMQWLPIKYGKRHIYRPMWGTDTKYYIRFCGKEYELSYHHYSGVGFMIDDKRYIQFTRKAIYYLEYIECIRINKDGRVDVKDRHGRVFPTEAIYITGAN